MTKHLATSRNPSLRHMIVSKDTIDKQATAAAQQGRSLDDACPYPFGTEAADHFKAVHLLALPKARAATASEETPT